MTLTLHFHPFSSYCQKALVALDEAGVAFEKHVVNLGDPEEAAALRALWPMGKFPVLVDQARGRTIAESSIIIEYLALNEAGAAGLVPKEGEAALRVRMLDRFFDNYVMTPMQRIVSDYIRPEEKRDPVGVEEARGLLDQAYAWLDDALQGQTWAAGDAFTMADCAGAPSLFYADLLAPTEKWPTLDAYRRRLRARPSFARAVDEARDFRPFFPPGWPEGKD